MQRRERDDPNNGDNYLMCNSTVNFAAYQLNYECLTNNFLYYVGKFTDINRLVLQCMLSNLIRRVNL